jgi:hypothetical protein
MTAVDRVITVDESRPRQMMEVARTRAFHFDG